MPARRYSGTRNFARRYHERRTSARLANTQRIGIGWMTGTVGKIASCKQRELADFLAGRAPMPTKGSYPADVWRASLLKVLVLNAVHDLRDLGRIPGYHYTPLKGQLKGYHTIRINEKYRLKFRWSAEKAYDVEIVEAPVS